MDIEHTPPKKRVQINISTPPLKENPENTPALQKSNFKRSNRKGASSPFSPTKTPGRSSRKLMVDSSDDEVSRLEADYIYIRGLGNGNFSSVALYQSKMTGQFFAIKKNTISSMSVNEIQALATLSMVAESCKNIVRYYHSWLDSEYSYIAMEYCDKSLEMLYETWKSSGVQPAETDMLRYCREILLALKYLHGRNIVHLDLKPDNILFSDDTLKISDLGLCRLARVKKWMELTEGDSRYLDKNILNYDQDTDLTKGDIFSLGITLYEAITLEDLPNNGDKWQDLRRGISLADRMDLQQYSK